MTKNMYFSPTDGEETRVQFRGDDQSDSNDKNKLSVPKLKILKNEKLQAQKVQNEPSAENESEQDLAAEKSSQVITNKYLVKVLSQQQNYLRRCFENHLRSNAGPVEKGTLLVEFMVLPHGEIRDVEIRDSNFNDKIFENCIKTVFLRTQVKKFAGEKFLITFPLEFE